MWLLNILYSKNVHPVRNLYPAATWILPNSLNIFTQSNSPESEYTLAKRTYYDLDSPAFSSIRFFTAIFASFCCRGSCKHKEKLLKKPYFGPSTLATQLARVDLPWIQKKGVYFFLNTTIYGVILVHAPQHFEPFHTFNFQEVDRENFQKVWVPEYDNSIGKLTWFTDYMCPNMFWEITTTKLKNYEKQREPQCLTLKETRWR